MWPGLTQKRADAHAAAHRPQTASEEQIGGQSCGRRPSEVLSMPCSQVSLKLCISASSFGWHDDEPVAAGEIGHPEIRKHEENSAIEMLLHKICSYADQIGCTLPPLEMPVKGSPEEFAGLRHAGGSESTVESQTVSLETSSEAAAHNRRLRGCSMCSC